MTTSPRAWNASTSAAPRAPPAPQTRATSATLPADFGQELAAQVGVLERAAPHGRDRLRALLDAAHLRAEVRRFEMHGDPERLDQLDERVRDLLREPFLHREPTRVEPHEAGQIGRASW